MLPVIPKVASVGSQSASVLSKGQLDFYNENGFLVIKDLIDFASLYNLKKRFVHIAKGIEDAGNIIIVKDPTLIAKGASAEDSINKIQDIHFDNVFSTYSEDQGLLDVVSQLIGQDVVVVHSMLINKPPGTNRHPPHQDLYYFPFRPADKIVAAWTAIDHVNQENGCLYVVPKSHKLVNLIAHQVPADTNKLYHGIVDESMAPDHRRVHLPMAPGDTVFFHPLLIHGSGPNVSKGYRKAITCHFANGSCHYIDIEGTIQESVARAVEEQANRRKIRLSYVDMWRFKNKLVRGVKSSL
ncbi:unnamed protein product, partial [Iphiclides podalirius]